MLHTTPILLSWRFECVGNAWMLELKRFTWIDDGRIRSYMHGRVWFPFFFSFQFRFFISIIFSNSIFLLYSFLFFGFFFLHEQESKKKKKISELCAVLCIPLIYFCFIFISCCHPICQLFGFSFFHSFILYGPLPAIVNDITAAATAAYFF